MKISLFASTAQSRKKRRLYFWVSHFGKRRSSRSGNYLKAKYY